MSCFNSGPSTKSGWTVEPVTSMCFGCPKREWLKSTWPSTKTWRLRWLLGIRILCIFLENIWAHNVGVISELAYNVKWMYQFTVLDTAITLQVNEAQSGVSITWTGRGLEAARVSQYEGSAVTVKLDNHVPWYRVKFIAAASFQNKFYI